MPDGVVVVVLGLVLGVVLGVVGAVVGWVAGFVGAVVGGSVVSVVTFPRHPANRLAMRTKVNAIIAVFFMVVPPEIQFTKVVFPPIPKLDWKFLFIFEYNLTNF